jgi:hypothetical protein
MAKPKLNAVAQNKLDKLSAPAVPGRSREVNKELPLQPDEIAGLRDHQRQYTKELEAAAKPHRKLEVDPNHAYPNREESTTLRLSTYLSVSVVNLFLAGLRPKLDVKCGPLLRYVSTDYSCPDGPLALYTMLLLTNDGESVYTPAPILEIAGIDTDQEVAATQLSPEILHQERGYTFWRWKIYLNLIAYERRLAYRINRSLEDLGFWVPADNQSMRIVFYSCNGMLPVLNVLIFKGSVNRLIQTSF